MVKVKFDVSGSDPADAKGGNVPKPGVYKAKIKEVKLGFAKTDGKPDKKRPRLEPVVVINEGTAKTGKGFNLFDYIELDPEGAQVWKMDQFLQAVGIATDKKRKGELDLDKLKGVELKVRVKADSYEGNPTAKIGAFLPLEDEDDEDDEDEDDEEVEDEDDESEDDEDEDEDDEDSDDEDDDEDEDEDEDDDEDEEEDDEEDEEDEEEEPPAKPVKKATSKKAEPPAKKSSKKEEAKPFKKAAKKAKKMPDDYNDWDLNDLKAECETREIKSTGSKTQLVKRLNEWDTENPI